MHCSFYGSQPTHFPVFHKEDVQGVEGAEVEHVYVVFHSHLEAGKNGFLSKMDQNTPLSPSVPHPSMIQRGAL